MTPEDRIRKNLQLIYGKDDIASLWAKILQLIDKYRDQSAQASDLNKSQPLSERDVFLITYADQIQQPGEKPLETLLQYAKDNFEGSFSGIHLLPFYPFSSDDGFSVIDYRKIEPSLGNWEMIQKIGEDFILMFDAVINHISRKSAWFQNYIAQIEPFRDYFIEAGQSDDLALVTRPRALPLLTEIDTRHGKRYLWTTFSEDQIDLNYKNPQVLLEIIDLLLFYVSKGARIIRLDAIAYLWKQVGTSCIHLPETHAIIKIFRAVLDIVAPHVLLITETNVPHKENIQYFGKAVSQSGMTDEAQLVYQFPLAPLVLDAFVRGSSRVLSNWVSELDLPGIFFNFIASHDGIGLMPASGLLGKAEISSLVQRTIEHGGQVSYKTNPDGSKSVYELNATLFDILNNPNDPQPDLDVKRFLASQVILLSLAGVPGIYFHSLFGSHNFHDCVRETQRARSINRGKFSLEDLEEKLSQTGSPHRQIFDGYTRLLEIRRSQKAFHPMGGQQVVNQNPSVFSVVRTAPSGNELVLCLVNVSDRHQKIIFSPQTWGYADHEEWVDLIKNETHSVVDGDLSMMLAPYQASWLKSTRSTS